MFEIKFRIVDDIDYLRKINVIQFNKDMADIEGFFSLNINGKIEGYYHDNPLRENEKGEELLTLWFELLVEVIITLKLTKYVGLREVECYNRWIEFILEDNNLTISLMMCQECRTSKHIITSPQLGFVYTSWKNEIIPFALFVTEVKKSAIAYIEEVNEINPELKRSFLISNLKQKLKQI